MKSQELVLREGSDFFAKWSKFDAPMTTKFFMYEVQNPEEVEFNGSIPVLKEKGPYTFAQRKWKEINGFEDRSRLLSYKEFKTYHFLRDKSIGGLEDQMTAVNIPVVVSIIRSFAQEVSSPVS